MQARHHQTEVVVDASPDHLRHELAHLKKAYLALAVLARLWDLGEECLPVIIRGSGSKEREVEGTLATQRLAVMCDCLEPPSGLYLELHCESHQVTRARGGETPEWKG